MTSATASPAGTSAAPASADGGAAAASSPATPSFTRRVVRVALAGFGARAGLAWIAIIALLAVFAPLLANSHPFAIKIAGQWSSPWFDYLTWVDITLLVTFIAVISLAFLWRWSVGRRAMLLAAIVAVTAVLAGFTKSVPKTVSYQKYRVAAAMGRVEAAWYAAIRFSPDDRLNELERAENRPPDRQHWMGTAGNATDVAANFIYASRVALSIGFVATGVAVVLGVIMGGVMGYFAGWVDLIGMRFVEIFQAIPTLLLLLAFVPLFLEHGEYSLYIMMAVIGFLNSFGYAEFVRAEFLTLRNRDFVHAARAAGLPLRSILFRHILPNGLTPVIVNVSFGIAGAILTETTLSFLGIGLKNDASWANLLNQALGSSGRFYWWLAIYPGMAIFFTVFSYNLIGEGFRDALDPRLNKTE